MHDVERCSGYVGDIGRSLYGIGLDEGWPCGIPGGKAALAVGVLRLDAITQNPRDFDRLRMRTDHAAIGGRRLAKPEQEAIVDIGQPEARPFASAVVHEYLEARRAEIPRIGRQAGKLRFG